MAASFFSEGLNWRSHGFFCLPLPRKDNEFRASSQAALWLHWEDVLIRARQGDFQGVASLLESLDRILTPMLENAYAELIGDAANGQCAQSAMRWLQVEPARSYSQEIAICQALTNWGRLSVVPFLVKRHELLWQNKAKEKGIIPVWISELVEQQPGPISFPFYSQSKTDYHDLVMKRYEELKIEFGTDQVFIYRGARFSVLELAKDMLSKLRDKVDLGEEYRHKFEAATGINCSAFFKDDKLQPLAAATILEEFMESSRAKEFEPGVRYFFGHRIPD